MIPSFKQITGILLVFWLSFYNIAHAGFWHPSSFGDGFYGNSHNNSLPIPTEMLASSRLKVMGSTYPAYSNGTDTGSNSRIATFNETGTGITSFQVYFTNWIATAANESNNANDIHVRASVEYPAGTFTAIYFDSSRDVTIDPGETAESDNVSLSIPADAQFWIRTYVTVSTGEVWPQSYIGLEGTQGRPPLGEAINTGTSTSDLTTSGTITHGGSGVRGYGPVAIKATGFSSTPKKIAIVGVGDSIMQGSGDGIFDSHGNIGWLGRATTGRCPFLDLSIAGQQGHTNLAVNFDKRLDLIQKVHPTMAVVGYGVNDLSSASTTLSILQNDLSAIWNMLANKGLLVTQTTITPRTTSTDSWATVGNQSAYTGGGGNFVGGTSSTRSLANQWIRSNPAPLWTHIDQATATESAVDSGLWNINSNWSNPAYTLDGLHPVNTNLTLEYGGVYTMRNTFITLLDAWLLL